MPSDRCTCVICLDEQRRQALRSILSLLDGREWSGETCADIAEVLRGLGYEVRDVAEVL